MEVTDVHNTYLTPKESAEYVRLSRVTLWRAAKSGLLKQYGHGTAVRYRRDELDRFMEARHRNQ